MKNKLKLIVILCMFLCSINITLGYDLNDFELLDNITFEGDVIGNWDVFGSNTWQMDATCAEGTRCLEYFGNAPSYGGATKTGTGLAFYNNSKEYVIKMHTHYIINDALQAGLMVATNSTDYQFASCGNRASPDYWAWIARNQTLNVSSQSSIYLDNTTWSQGRYYSIYHIDSNGYVDCYVYSDDTESVLEHEGNDLNRFDGTHTTFHLSSLRSAEFDDVEIWIEKDPVVAKLIWSGEEPANGKHINSDTDFFYEVETGNFPLNCSFYVDDTLNETTTGIASADTYNFTYEVSGNDGVHTFYVNCTDALSEDTSGIKTITVDTIDPIINVNEPNHNGYYYLQDGLDYDVEFDNVNLNNTNVSINSYVEEDLELLNSSNQMVGTVNKENLTLGQNQITFYVIDDAELETTLTYNVTMLNCSELVTDWQPQLSACNTSNQQVLTYFDDNECGTSLGLPANNGSTVSCDYCTPNITIETTGCVAPVYRNVTTYTLENNATCCALTGLSEDCDIRSNANYSCIGQYQGSDIAKVTVDNAVEIGSAFVELAPLVALGVMALVSMGFVFIL
jgi:hypothetical protein